MKNATTAPAARLRAFHASRRNAAASALRWASSPAAVAVWQAVIDAHAKAAKTGTRADSDRAEAAHAAANRTHGPA